MILASTLLLAAAAAPGGAGPMPAPTPRGLELSHAVEVRAVLVDVAVTDRRGRFVPGLKREDFTVLDDGVEQAIDDFREVRHRPPVAAPAGAAAGGEPVVPAAAAELERTQPQGASTAPLAPRHLAFVFDFTSLRRDSVHRFRRDVAAVAAWAARNLTADDRVSLAFVGPELQYRIDDRPFDDAVQGALLAAGDDAGAQVDSPFDASLITDGVIPDVEPLTKQALEGINRGQEAWQAERLIDALEDVARRLATRRGKKAMVLVSDGQGGGAGRPTTLRRLSFEYRRLLQEAEVTVYAVHTGGIGTFGRTAEERPQVSTEETFVQAPEHQGNIWERQALLFPLANETGGKLIRNTENIAAALERVAGEIGSYYQLSYSPSRPARPGRFQRIEVRVAGDGLRVRHRDGYWTPKAYAAMDARERDQAFLAALDGDARQPPLTGAVSLVPADAAGPAVTAAHGAPGAPGPELGVVVSLEAGVLGSRSAGQLQVMVEVRDGFGRALGRLHDVVRLPAATAAAAASRGFEYLGRMAAPAAAVSARVVVRDESDGRTLAQDLPVPAAGSAWAMALEGDRNPVTAGKRQLLAFRGAPVHARSHDVVAPGVILPVLVCGVAGDLPLTPLFAPADGSGDLALGIAGVEREDGAGRSCARVQVATGACRGRGLLRFVGAGGEPGASLPLLCY